MKKLSTILLLGTFFVSGNIGFAQGISDIFTNKTPVAVEQPKSGFVLPATLEKELKSNISDVYGVQNTEEIYNKILDIASNSIKNRPQNLVDQDLTRKSDWYKDEVIYMFYADQFGTISSDIPNTFKDSAKMLRYLKDLGVTTIYILPFADSPMNDSGFDVKNPKNVRADLGGMPEFKNFVLAAKENGFKIKADLILNHFSDQHEWFQQALKGDTDKLNYFIVREEMPEFKRYFDEKKGVIVEYKEPNGKISKRRLMFPDTTENHWRKVTIQEKDYYLYHTFYPFQLDINWENPEVLYYCLNTISYWANLGVDIFRMDAIPYFIKEEGSTAENLDKTHNIVKIISAYLQATAPSTVLQAEACQYPKDILPYFGKERDVATTIKNEAKTLTRTDEIQIAYHFPYMPALWATFLTENNKYFTDANKATPQIPNSSSWATFLRVHDELTLEMVDPSVRKVIYDELEPKGAPFREGLGVSGRMANFLDNNPDRIIMAYSTLFSLPGIPIIYYGDEIATQNNFNYAEKEAQKRENTQKKNKLKLLSFFDSRDINRGSLTYDAFYSVIGKGNRTVPSKVYNNVKHMIDVRKSNEAFTRGSLTLLKTKSPRELAYTREYNGHKYLIVHNLSKFRRVVDIELPLKREAKYKNRNYVLLQNILNGQQYKVNISKSEKSVHLLMYPYATVWLKLF